LKTELRACEYRAYYRRRICGDRHDGYKPGAGADWQARSMNEGESRREILMLIAGYKEGDNHEMPSHGK